MSSLLGQVGLKMDSRAQRSYLDGLHSSWAMWITLFGMTFLCALIPKRGKVPRLGEDGGKDATFFLRHSRFELGLTV
ncbi:unnamed protein product [Penicillium camemberti]|uniref:Str. FM013 n=1 Tax=Penicillium camemberti (strain FM 013) TaxID=1429867 RepID=A0A0G4PG34_PENC3|nr:unnamed protein product [Penicillium camemberti]